MEIRFRAPGLKQTQRGMNNAPAGGIYVLSYTPGGYIHVHTPQSGTSRNPKPHSEFPAKTKQTLLKSLIFAVKL